MRRLLPMVLICSMLINSFAFSETVEVTDLENTVEINSIEEISEEVTIEETTIEEAILEEVNYEEMTSEVTTLADVTEAETEAPDDTTEASEAETFEESTVAEDTTETVTDIEKLTEITSADYEEELFDYSINFNALSAYASSNDASVVVNYVLSRIGQTYKSHACLSWVKDVFKACYGYSSSACCAYTYGSSYIDSTSRNNIPLGADVFFAGSKIICGQKSGKGCFNHAGHVGIYVGNGYVVHNWSGKVTKSTIDYIIRCGYPYRGWGWHANVALINTPSAPLTLNDIQVPTVTLKEGATGGEVLKLQKFLNYFMNAGLAYDSKFGPATVTAVKNFQSKYGLAVDGSVGPATRSKMNEVLNAAKAAASDKTPPVISNVSITDVTTDGYTVNCTVSDNDRVTVVKFPTWTENNGQDDITWGEIAVNTNSKALSYRVNRSDHKGELGLYYTHIYAYDPNGNYISASAPDMYFENEAPVISDVNISNVTSEGYTVSCTITDNRAVGRIQYPTWTENNGQDDLIWHTYTENANTQAVNATFRVKREDHKSEYGKYITHIYAWDLSGNQTIYVLTVNLKQYSNCTPDDIFEYNGNIYCMYNDALDWNVADTLCKSMGGHLVTINDEKENAEIARHMKNLYYYIGLNDINSEGNFVWIDGSTSSYRNFNEGEPNNTNGDEDCVVMLPGGKWNDTPIRLNAYSEKTQIGFILEIEKSAFNMNHSEGFKSNMYEFYSNALPYSAAEYYAKSKGGHLVTIGSAEENNFVKKYISKNTWLGLNDAKTEGKFEWITGEALNYTNWDNGEPNNDNDREDCGEMLYPSGVWNDSIDSAGDTSFVIEYENANVNNDNLKLELSGGSAVPGGYVDIPVRIKENKGIAVIGFDVSYDTSAMTLSYVKAGNVFSSSEIAEGVIGKNPYTVSALCATSNKTTNGTIVTMTFKINNNCPIGKYNIKVSNVEAYNIDEKAVGVDAINGVVNVSNTIIGDINGDGLLNRNDLLRFGKYFAGQNVEINKATADVNNDGVLNRNDLLRLGKYFAGWDVKIG